MLSILVSDESLIGESKIVPEKFSETPEEYE